MRVTAELIGGITAEAALFSLIDTEAELTQLLQVDAVLSRIVEATAVLSGNIEADAEIVNKVRVSHEGYEDYDGPYEATSFCADPLLTSSLVLQTNDKHMLDDVTIYSVPTREEYNEAGGVTFIIGG